MTQSKQVHIQCERVGNGMFPNEVAVRIKNADGSTVTAFVDESTLVDQGSELFLRATKIESEGGMNACLLPTENTDSGSRWVHVQNASLLEMRLEPQPV